MSLTATIARQPGEYSELAPAVIENINFVIHPGEHVAIAGPSGCGKSTLMKILLGLYQPSSGCVLVDDVPLPEFGVQQLRQQTGAVLQDDCLFSGSLLENISMFDDDIDQDRVEIAAKMAGIAEEIACFPMRYETRVGELGSSLSGGQRQRILIARALYRNPSLLVLAG